MGDRGHIGAPEDELGPSKMAWIPSQSLITLSFDDVGALQKKLVPVFTHVNICTWPTNETCLREILGRMEQL